MSLVPNEINVPREASHSFCCLFFVFFIYVLYTRYLHYILFYISTYLLIFGFGGEPVGQPPLDPIRKALHLPKPHPSNKTV